MKKKQIILFTIVASLSIIGCRKVDFDVVDRTEGEADFTKYIALGNSLTQGYADGGLYEEGQSQSYPSIIAKQMSFVNSNMGEFAQPMTSGNGSGYMHLEFINNEIDVISTTDPNAYTESSTWADWGTNEKNFKYNNLGISGIKLVNCVDLNSTDEKINHLFLAGVQGLFNGNPYSRYLDWGGNPIIPFSEPPIQYVDHVKSSGATFFSSWLGNNDVLSYATSGGNEGTTDLSLLGLGVVKFSGLSDPTEFHAKYDTILKALYDMGAKGIVATLPDVTSIPNLNTITVSGLKETGWADVWITDMNGNVRVGTDNDLIILSASTNIENGEGSSQSNPLDKDLVLDEDEVALCQSRTIDFNNSIVSLAAKYDFAVADMHAYMTDLKSGLAFDGINFTPQYIEGGLFSLDGVHLNPRGYAVIANKFISEINAHYGSNIPKTDIGKFRGIVFP